MTPPFMDHIIEKIVDAVQHRLLTQGLQFEHPRKGKTGACFQNDKPIRKNVIHGKNQINIASYIDHTLLKPDASHQSLEQLCKEARQYHFWAVCVNSSHVAHVAELLKDSDVKPIAVVGFPLGAATTTAKAFEAREAIQAGAKEIDMVMNIGALKDRNYLLALTDIAKVVEAAKPYPVKVILETAMLSTEEKIIACVLSKVSGAAFVKTSTGFGPGGATVEDVQLMRKIVGPEMGVKASGGIRSYKDAVKMIEAGANRLGTSNGAVIVTGKDKGYGY